MAKRKLPKNIQLLPDGTFRVRFRRKDLNADEPFARLEDAERFKDLLELDRKHRRHGLPSIRTRRDRLVDLIADYLARSEDRAKEGSLRTSTLLMYQQCLAGPLKWLEQHAPGLLASEFRQETAARYAAWRQQQPLSEKARRIGSDVQARKDLAALRRVYRAADLTPSWSIPRRLRRNKGGKRILTPEELLRFLEAMPLGSVERTVAEIEFATGIRPSDVHRFEETNLDWSRRLFQFRPGKTPSKELQVPFDEHVEEHLRAYLGAQVVRRHDRRIFHLNGRAVTNDSLRARFRKASSKAGIKPPIEYIGGLRNWVIAALLEAGIDPRTVALYVGHEGLALLPDYARSYRSPDALRRASEALTAIRKRHTDR